MTNAFLENKIKEIFKTPAQNFLTDFKIAIKLLNMLFNTDQLTLYKRYVVENVYNSQSQKIKKGHYLGFIELESEKLPVFLFEHQGTVDTKISLLTEITKILGDFNTFKLNLPFIKNALILFIPLAKHENNWKLSLVSSFSEKATAYKRHSYILGPDAQIRVTLEELYIKLRNYIEKTNSLSIERLKQAFEPEPLTKQFYQELIAWFYWAHQTVKFPIGDGSKRQNKINQEALVRFLTRILFIWFLKQKKLIPNKLFDTNYLSKILKEGDKLKKNKKTIYYKAILQNLFFATLNVKVTKRRFRDQQRFLKGYNKDFGNQYVYRFLNLFNTNEKEIKNLFKDIPFLNGGLFERLDQPKKNVYYDGFTERKQYQPDFPDYLFFADEHKEKINAYKKYLNVSGLFNILNKYHFTVTENTPLDKDVALDPELLGHIFENLLAEQLDETKQNARKSTGSFYTPHEIVDFMVEESLKEYLKTNLLNNELNNQKIEKFLKILFNITTTIKDLQDYKDYIDKTIKLISEIKIIDPAVGSGAFPMGILNKITFLLKKLDPNNEKWKQEQLQKLESLDMPDNIKEEQKKKLLETFNKKDADYTRKLYIIRDSIYGVDIQPIAIQIARLRFFLSLIVDEKQNKSAENFGIQPLPNLYMNFVIANSLIPLEYTTKKINPLQPKNQLKLNINLNIEKAKEKWFKISKDLYWVSDHKRKEALKKKEEQARLKLAEVLKGNYTKDYKRIKTWDPYNPHQSANWFDPFFMLRVENGFDIVIANPPYVGEKNHKHIFDKLKENAWIKKYYQGKMDLFYFFIHKAIDLLKERGIGTFITTNYYVTADGAYKLRKRLKTETFIIKLVNLHEVKIFESALGQHNMITIFEKNKTSKKNSFYTQLIFTKLRGKPSPKLLKDILNGVAPDTKIIRIPYSDLFYSTFEYILNRVDDLNILNILRKIANSSNNVNLGNICNINQGIVTGADRVTSKHIKRLGLNIPKGTGIFVLSNSEVEQLRLSDKERQFLKPWFKNSDIHKWYTNSENTYTLLYIPHSIKSIPYKLVEHLKRFKRILNNRREVKDKRYKWFMLHRPRDKRIFEQPKIVVPQRSYTNKFAYTEKPWYASADVYFITTKDERFNLKYILAILNSKLIYYWLYYFGKRKGEMLELYATPLKQLPIPKIPSNQQKPFIELVDKILQLTNKENYENHPNLQKKVEEYSKEIDRLVYKLYGLTENEIKLVENRRTK